MIETIDQDYHPSEEEFMDFLYQEMNAGNVMEFNSHIAECSECAELLNELKGTMNILDDSSNQSEPTVPHGMELRLLNSIATSAAGIELSATNDSVRDFSNRNSEPPALLTPEDIAALLSIPEEAVYDLLNDIPHLNLAGHIRFRSESVTRWLQIREKNSPDAFDLPVDQDISPFLWREDNL
ncbi:MAG: hypothetical protein CVV64_16015 [Candidatus Wallbacteria bacterium HGW-Wallbacteria-1]|jgi:hypothetical protein|uniref:Helix-turn-helix domain-containing protein n=1 Tax=Candidatus Wallbacteria bacterium HGW-Wallbacteria-1 TaxID=2013854 RepID=A0A2N1PL21_9BACT|nr:MAG: hypothetical protein CVV64_16015 [Candidatus Wallbacteria bacterium HGW-Wallbacteria-1]